MAWETIALEAAVKGLVRLGVKVFGEMGKINIDKPIEQVLFNVFKKYVQNYSDRHGRLQLLGMSNPVELDLIYTSVRILDAEAMRNYENREALEERFRQSGARRFREHDCPKQDGIAIANDQQRLIVLGDPGIGKSTFLRKVGLEALKGQGGGYQYQKIPVFLELKRFSSAELDIKQKIAEEFDTCDFPNPEGFTEKALKKGNLLVLFDGLDEVPSANLTKVIQSIQDFVDKYSDNRFIVSCRIAAYHSYFKGVSTVAIAEFDDDQIKAFIFNWFSSPLDKESNIAQECWDLLSQKNNQGAKELAQSPLLLTFLCLVYNKSLNFPNNRSTLYEEALNILLKEWTAENRVKRDPIYVGFHADLEKNLLSKIAYEGFEKKQLFFSKEQLTLEINNFLGDALDAPNNLDATEVLKAIEVQQGIFVERAIDVYSFSHLTLQEYLTAKYVDKWNLLDDLVEFHATDERWREVFLMVISLKGDAAINLMKLLEIRARDMLKNANLRFIIEWVNEITLNSCSNYLSTARRVCGLSLIRELIYDRREETQYIRQYIPKQSIFQYLASYFGLSLSYYLSRRTQRDIARAKFYQDNKIFNLNLNELIVLLQERQSCEFSRESEYRDWTVSSWCKELDFPRSILLMDKYDLQVFNHYLKLNKLLIECRNNSSSLSLGEWNKIIDRMFSPS